MLYKSAESMASLGGIHPAMAIKALNEKKPQCPVHLQTLKFRPWLASSSSQQQENQSGSRSGAREQRSSDMTVTPTVSSPTGSSTALVSSAGGGDDQRKVCLCVCVFML